MDELNLRIYPPDDQIFTFGSQAIMGSTLLTEPEGEETKSSNTQGGPASSPASFVSSIEYRVYREKLNTKYERRNTNTASSPANLVQSLKFKVESLNAETFKPLNLKPETNEASSPGLHPDVGIEWFVQDVPYRGGFALVAH